MEGILKFDLNEDRREFELAVNAHKWYSVAWDIDQHLRALTKHAPDSQSDETTEAYRKIRDDIRDIIAANDVSLD